MANYYRLSNGAQSAYISEASLSHSLAARFSFANKVVSVEKISTEEFLDQKAQEWIDKNDPIYVQDMYTKTGLLVMCVKFAPNDDDYEDVNYVVIENGYKRLMRTLQKNLIEGDI